MIVNKLLTSVSFWVMVMLAALLLIVVCRAGHADGLEVSKNLTVNGIFQGRYGATEDAQHNWKSGSFDIRRAEVGLLLKAGDRVALKAQADFANGTTVTKDLWVRYLVVRGLDLRLGQMVVPFGLENQVSDADLLTLERATFDSVLFPNRRDRGVVAEVEGKGGQVVLGVFNGDGPNVSAPGRDKEGTVRVLAHLCPFFDLGGSVLYGNDKSGTKSAYGLDFQANLLLLTLTGEYVLAHDFGHSPKGWDVLVRLPLNTHLSVVGKYDRFDPDNTLDASGISNTYNVGLVQNVNKNLGLKLFYTNNWTEVHKQNNTVGGEVLVHF